MFIKQKCLFDFDIETVFRQERIKKSLRYYLRYRSFLGTNNNQPQDFAEIFAEFRSTAKSIQN